MHIALFQFPKNPNPVYQQIASALRRRGHVVWIATTNATGNLEWNDGKRVIATISGPAAVHRWLRRVKLIARICSRIQVLSFIVRVRKFLIHTRPNILLGNKIPFAWVLWLFMPDGIKVIFEIRQINENVSCSFIGRLKEQKTILGMKILTRSFCDHACFCNVKAARRILGENWAQRSTIVPIGIDPRFMNYDKFRATLKTNDNRVRFVYVGKLSRLRTLETILFGVKRLVDEGEKFQVDFVGRDAAHGFYHNLIDKLKLNSVVRIKGPISYKEIPSMLARYDVGLAYVPDRPTWHYQPTIKVLEYRAFGMPIISTNVESHGGIIEDGINGLLIQDSVEGMSMGMKRFITDHDFLERCKLNAQAMRQGRTWDEIAEIYERNVCQKVINVNLFQ